MGQYFSDSCHGCISDELASLLGTYFSKILNSVSATDSKFFTLIFFSVVFAVFAIDDEHFFELNYTGTISEILMRYVWDLIKAFLIYFLFVIVLGVIVGVKNRNVKDEYQQACVGLYMLTYYFLLHVCIAVSFSYGIFAHKGDVPPIGNAPYALKETYLAEPVKNAWYKTLSFSYSNIYLPIKEGIQNWLCSVIVLI